GTVDLYETLKPIIVDHPERRLVITIEHGRLRYRDPAFPEPVVADEAEIVLDLPRDPQPITWRMTLGRSAVDRPPRRLELTGSYERSEPDGSGRGDVTIALKAARWPWSLMVSGIEARGALDGTIDAERRSARWLLAGDAAISGLAADV